MAIQFIQKDKGGTIRHSVVDSAPLRWDDDPAPTVTLKTEQGAEIVASQAATLGSSTTLSTAAAARSSTLVVAAVTGISVGDIRCLGPNDGGQWEWVTVDSVDSSTKAVTLRDELLYTYASGDTFKSHDLSVSITSAEAAGVYHNARAEWAYEVSNEARVETSLCHISVWAPRKTLRDQDVLIRQPRARQMLGTRQRLSQLIDDVWERDIIEDLGAQYHPGSLVAGDALKQAHLYRVLAEIAVMSSDEEGRERYFSLYQTAWDRAMQQTLIDTDNNGEIDDEDIVRPAMTGRLYRSA